VLSFTKSEAWYLGQFGSGSESRDHVLREKLEDLFLSARARRRCRIVSEVLKGHGIEEMADRVGCHFTVAYDWICLFKKRGFRDSRAAPASTSSPPPTPQPRGMSADSQGRATAGAR